MKNEKYEEMMERETAVADTIATVLILAVVFSIFYLVSVLYQA